jgi:hypothetical protein
MILSSEDTERFDRIWFALLHFVNEQRQLVSSFPATWEQVSPSKVRMLRDALWADDGLRQAFRPLPHHDRSGGVHHRRGPL